MTMLEEQHLLMCCGAMCHVLVMLMSQGKKKQQLHNSKKINYSVALEVCNRNQLIPF